MDSAGLALFRVGLGRPIKEEPGAERAFEPAQARVRREPSIKCADGPSSFGSWGGHSRSHSHAELPELLAIAATAGASAENAATELATSARVKAEQPGVGLRVLFAAGGVKSEHQRPAPGVGLQTLWDAASEQHTDRSAQPGCSPVPGGTEATGDSSEPEKPLRTWAHPCRNCSKPAIPSNYGFCHEHRQLRARRIAKPRVVQEEAGRAKRAWPLEYQAGAPESKRR